VFVVLIGTNNLGSGFLPGPTADGIQAVVEYLLEETQGKVILQLLLPRGDNSRTASICPPRCADTNLRKPFASFQPAVDKVNEAIRQQRAELQRLHPGRFDVMDCGAAFVDPNNKSGVNLELMPDALHPNAAGHEVLATCLLDCLEETTCSFA
jgi:lysophospholipase L1-like esterase